MPVGLVGRIGASGVKSIGGLFLVRKRFRLAFGAGNIMRQVAAHRNKSAGFALSSVEVAPHLPSRGQAVNVCNAALTVSEGMGLLIQLWRTRPKLKDISTVLLSSCLVCSTACHAEEHLITQGELVHRTQMMLDGISRGDQTLWKLYLAEDVMVFDEKGNDQNKKALLDDIQPLPAGYTLALVVRNPKTRFASDVAILSYDSDETETVYGQHLTARYHTTDTWLYKNHVWQIVADQTLRYYEDPVRGSTPVASLKDFTGTYELAPGIQVTITRKGDDLYSQRGSNAPSVLIPESPDLFFRHGVEGRRLFHRLPSGQVDSLVERRNNEDIVWKKLP